MRDVNKKIQAEETKVALIIDNCPAHPITENLPHVKLVFLPPNTTSVSQPMNQSRHNKLSQGSLQATISKADTGHSRF